MEQLFADCVIQVLISTATLAWGVNLPAHLVIIKGGEYFDPKTHRYVDYAITDMLQMMGRAGRPQFDDSGEAVIMCTAAMKGFYKKFLYEPFPVESSLADVLHNHLNAEIVSGSITSRHDAVDYLTWTYLFRRILVNPTYYGLENSDLATVNKYLSQLVDETLHDLAESQCIELDDEDKSSIYPLTMGQIISYYYLHHKTARLFFTSLDENTTLPRLLQVLCMATEYAELPVRHNEDGLNEEMASDSGIRWALQSRDWEDPGVKVSRVLLSVLCVVCVWVVLGPDRLPSYRPTCYCKRTSPAWCPPSPTTLQTKNPCSTRPSVSCRPWSTSPRTGAGCTPRCAACI